MLNNPKHYEESRTIPAVARKVFDFADDHTNLSSHMGTSSMLMGGGKMKTETDGGHGKKTGSHIKMHGKVFGFNLYLDEAVTLRQPPVRKEWETVGDINLLVIGHYRMGFNIKPLDNNCNLKVFIDYEEPKTPGSKILGLIFGDFYAKWCVRQMLQSVTAEFN